MNPGEKRAVIGFANGTSRSLGFGLSAGSTSTRTVDTSKLKAFFSDNIVNNLSNTFSVDVYTKDSSIEGKIKTGTENAEKKDDIKSETDLEKQKREAEAKAEQERIQKEQEAIKAKEEAERLAIEAAQKKAEEEAAKKAQEELERKLKEEQDKAAQEELQRKIEEEKKKAEEEQKAREEAERLAAEAKKKAESVGVISSRVTYCSLDELKQKNSYVNEVSQFKTNSSSSWGYIIDTSSNYEYYGQIDKSTERQTGFGVFVDKNIKRTLVGEFKDDILNGKVKFYNTEKETTTLVSCINYVNGVKEGYGYQYDDTGEEYRGFYSNNNKSGIGRKKIKNVKNQNGDIIFTEIDQFAIFENNELKGPAMVFLIKSGSTTVKCCFFESNNKREGFTLDSSYETQTKSVFNPLENEITKDGSEYTSMVNFLNNTYTKCDSNPSLERDSVKMQKKQEEAAKAAEEKKKQEEEAKKDMLQKGEVEMPAYVEQAPANVNGTLVNRYADYMWMASEIIGCAASCFCGSSSNSGSGSTSSSACCIY